MSTVTRFERLYRDHFPFVWAAAHRCRAPRDAVDDVVQDVFVTAYRHLDDLRWEVSPRGWLYGVTRRVAFRYRRSAARNARRNAAVATASNVAAHPHDRHDAARTLESILERIDERQRAVFEMSELLGMSAPEIAAELVIPLNTVYSRLRLARKRLASLAGSDVALAAEVAATHGAAQPPSHQRARTWAAIAPVLRVPWLPLKLGLASITKLIAVPVTVAATAAVVILTAAPADEQSEPGAPTIARHEPVSPAPPSVPASAATAALLSSEAPPADPPVVLEPDAPPRARNLGARAPSRGTQALSIAASAPADESLAAEVALLDRAKSALARGDTMAALSALDDHRARFPKGQLLEASAVTRFHTLCRAGRAQEAETAAMMLHRAHPNSNLARHTPTQCPAL